MEITTHKFGVLDIHQVNEFNRKFTVSSKLVLKLENGKLVYAIVSVPPYEKEIPVGDVDVMSFINSDEKVIFFADVQGDLAGRIKVIAWWNQFAYIDDLIVNPEFRGQGIGRTLMDRAIEWAKEKRFPGIMLETQDDNVVACKFYESCGFVLGGFDGYVYKNTKPNETALYWYLIF